MSIWDKYTECERDSYILYLKSYASLSKLFIQKSGQLIPYLDSKFQESAYAKAFGSEVVDINNTPHDILSIFGQERIGIGIKTWMDSNASYQKVMQLKKYREELDTFTSDDDLIEFLSKLRNQKLESDHHRLGLNSNSNIYHYITRDIGSFSIFECPYLKSDLSNIRPEKGPKNSKAIYWTDGFNKFKYTKADSQIHKLFDPNVKHNVNVKTLPIEILQDPFNFITDFYTDNFKNNFLLKSESLDPNIEEVYLPLYSYRSGEVEDASGLNAWRAAPKNKGSFKERPLNEVYIPIPIDFHRKCSSFFCPDIMKVINEREHLKSLPKYLKNGKVKPEVRFQIELPTGKVIPGLITADRMKQFQSGNITQLDDTGKISGQALLGQWLLIDVLGLKRRQPVTRDWLEKKGSDSIRVWKTKGSYDKYFIDLAPVGAFDAFMNDEPIPMD